MKRFIILPLVIALGVFVSFDGLRAVGPLALQEDAGEETSRAEAIRAHFDKLVSEDKDVKREALLYFGKVDKTFEAEVPLFTAALKDKRYQVRAISAYALGKIGGAAVGSIPDVEELLSDSSASVQKYAKRALERLRTLKPDPKKLTAKEAADALAFWIGKWESEGIGARPGETSVRQVGSTKVRWKEKGKSIQGMGTSKIGDEPEVKFLEELEYDQGRGIFIWRSKHGDQQEKVIHRRYDPATRTYHDKWVSPELPRGITVKSSTRITGPDSATWSVEFFNQGKLDFSAKGEMKRVREDSGSEPLDGRGGGQPAADIGSFHPERSFKDSGGASGFTWSPDGRQLASPHGSTLKIWDATSGKEAHTLAGYNKDMPAFSISWSPDGKRLAAGGGDALRVWDISSGKTIYSIEASPIGGACVAWSPDGKKVAGCGGDKITVWDIDRKEELWSGKGHSAPLGTIAWSPDGKKLASGSWDRTVVIWDPTPGKIIKSLSTGQLAVYQVAWSPDGTKIAACGDNNNTVSRKTVLVWEVGSWEEFDQLVGHSTGPALSRSLAWSPDGHSLLTGGERGHIKVWDINISKVRQTLTGNGGPVLYLGWSPDGTRIAAKGVTAGPYGLSTWLLAK